MFLGLSLPLVARTVRKEFPSSLFAIMITLLLVLFYNAAFFAALTAQVDYSSLRGVLFVINVTLLLTLITFIFISLIVLPYVAKPLVAVVLLSAAGVAYFMDTYGIVMHRLMIQNTVETDLLEVRGLLNGTLICYLLVLGVLPIVVVFNLRITFHSVKRELWLRLKYAVLAILASVLLIASMSADYASFFRNHKEVRQMTNPLSLVAAGTSFLTASSAPLVVKPIENDAKLSAFGQQQTKPSLFILVVGETARADHFGLNGYERDTTPLLAQQNIINFSQVQSCGTETAVSVPCMFSNLGRSDYSDRKAKSQQGLLDVIQHAGISVLWRDNNSSCKGTCDRVSYEDVQHIQVPELCNERECFDPVLLYKLDEKIAASKGSKVIVLHQKGSHGPDYFNRYPASHEYFTPACKDNQLQKCSRAEVVNAFDNTIRYTDYFLNATLIWLAAQNGVYNTSLLYLSDHGESLGESHLYLHGMPYAIAPQEQKHVPLFLWFSEGFKTANQIDTSCLRQRSADAYSHDNLFHTVLGLLNIRTQVYNADLDMIKPCRASAANH